MRVAVGEVVHQSLGAWPPQGVVQPLPLVLAVLPAQVLPDQDQLRPQTISLASRAPTIYPLLNINLKPQ